ncbi:MAG: hypothetical protein ACOZE5_10135 [Verrucomicrobiota bacterium]
MKILKFIPGKTNAWKIVIAGLPLVFGIWVIYGLLKLDRPVTTWGVFGDKFGALNTLFTGFALVGLLATLVHQHDEIKSSKEDLDKVLVALIGTTQALNNQNLIARKANYITALVARIEGYNRQQDLAAGRAHAPGRLGDEQNRMFMELDIALGKARRDAESEGNEVRD